MILAAGLLVLLGLGLFVAGLLTGATGLYWACVAACAAAGLLLVVARRQISRAAPGVTRTAGADRTRSAAAAVRTPPAAGAERTFPAAGAERTFTAGPAERRPPAATDDGTPPATDVASAPPAEAVAAPAADPSPELSPGPSPAPPAGSTTYGPTAHGATAHGADLSDPPVEDVEWTDLLLVVDLKDEVLVVDERPRYHLPGCVHLDGRTTIALPVDEARRDGFTPCAVCEPDRNLAERARARKAARGS